MLHNATSDGHELLLQVEHQRAHHGEATDGDLQGEAWWLTAPNHAHKAGAQRQAAVPGLPVLLSLPGAQDGALATRASPAFHIRRCVQRRVLSCSERAACCIVCYAVREQLASSHAVLRFRRAHTFERKLVGIET